MGDGRLGGVGVSGVHPAHLVPGAEQGRGQPEWQDLGRLQLQVLQECWKRRRRRMRE